MIIKPMVYYKSFTDSCDDGKTKDDTVDEVPLCSVVRVSLQDLYHMAGSLQFIVKHWVHL